MTGVAESYAPTLENVSDELELTIYHLADHV